MTTVQNEQATALARDRAYRIAALEQTDRILRRWMSNDKRHRRLFYGQATANIVLPRIYSLPLLRSVQDVAWKGIEEVVSEVEQRLPDDVPAEQGQ